LTGHLQGNNIKPYSFIKNKKNRYTLQEHKQSRKYVIHTAPKNIFVMQDMNHPLCAHVTLTVLHGTGLIM